MKFIGLEQVDSNGMKVTRHGYIRGGYRKQRDAITDMEKEIVRRLRKRAREKND